MNTPTGDAMQPEDKHNDSATWKPMHDHGCYCERCVDFAVAESDPYCDNCGTAHADATAVCGNYHCPDQEGALLMPAHPTLTADDTVKYVGLDHSMQGMTGTVVIGANWRNPEKVMVLWHGFKFNSWERIINLEATV